MRMQITNPSSRTSLLTAALLVIGATVNSADTPVTLKDAFKDSFNRFNFDTLVDVLLTIEYTAINDDQKVSGGLKGMTADTPLSIRTAFSDDWYHLKNPTSIPTVGNPYSLTLDLKRYFFPPNFSDDLGLAHVTLIIVGKFPTEQYDDIKTGIRLKKKKPPGNTNNDCGLCT
jgi:hypothetical protein